MRWSKCLIIRSTTGEPHDDAQAPRQQPGTRRLYDEKAQIDAMLIRLTDLSADHFDVSPDSLHWGHVGNLECYAELLKRITDAAFLEGEHAT